MSYTDGNIQGGKFNKGEKYPGDLWDVRYHSNGYLQVGIELRSFT